MIVCGRRPTFSFEVFDVPSVGSMPPSSPREAFAISGESSSGV